ncbi:MAG: DUF2782 domain-containing protein [Magnetococcales bacterium]|nr:DUF2782 domain-containing protein [Magnetococcales bacterium]MBF0309278.1 DUF2782 domain-containing protein [Magnetococcales bacterium]
MVESIIQDRRGRHPWRMILPFCLFFLSLPPGMSQETDFPPAWQPPSFQGRLVTRFNESSPDGAPMEIRLFENDAGDQLREFSIGGRAFLIEVSPVRDGEEEYHLVDLDGDGRFEERRTGLALQLTVPHWALHLAPPRETP